MKEKKETGNSFIIINEHRFEAVVADAMSELLKELDDSAKEHGNFSPATSMKHMMLLTLFAADVHKVLFDDGTARVETSGIDTSDLTDEELNDHNTDDEFTL